LTRMGRSSGKRRRRAAVGVLGCGSAGVGHTCKRIGRD
jgi:hypothetical protein